jgi:hypothetical protein
LILPACLRTRRRRATTSLTQTSIDVTALLQERRPTLVVLDAFTGALTIQELDPNKGTEVEVFYRKVVAPLRAYGAATVILDHLAKRHDNGMAVYAIGSERKVAGCDVHLRFEQVTPFGRGRSGLATVTVKKDRPGYLVRPKVAELMLASDGEEIITWKLELTQPETPFRPTVLMERISRHLEAQSGPVSQHAVDEVVKGKTDARRLAYALLVEEGFVGSEKGTRNATLLHSLRPYRVADDEAV